MKKTKAISKAKEGAIILAFRMKTERFETFGWTAFFVELENLMQLVKEGEEYRLISDIKKYAGRCSATWVKVREMLEEFGEKEDVSV